MRSWTLLAYQSRIPVYYNNNILLRKIHGPLLTYQSRIPVYYNNNALVHKVHALLLTYQSRIPVYYKHNTLVTGQTRRYITITPLLIH